MTAAHDPRARFLAAHDHALSLLGPGPARSCCEAAVRAFFAGVRGWSGSHPDDLAAIDALPPFAWEGIGLAAGLEGALELVLAARPDRAALIFVGVGWARALQAEDLAPPAAFDAWTKRFGAEAWSLFDGQGFAGTLLARTPRSRRPPTAAIAPWFDQGCGRALYFLHGGRAEAIAWAIDGRARASAPSLWRGVGIASRFTDGLDEPAREALRQRGGEALREGERRAEDLLSRTSAPAPDAAWRP